MEFLRGRGREPLRSRWALRHTVDRGGHVLSVVIDGLGRDDHHGRFGLRGLLSRRSDKRLSGCATLVPCEAACSLAGGAGGNGEVTGLRSDLLLGRDHRGGVDRRGVGLEAEVLGRGACRLVRGAVDHLGHLVGLLPERAGGGGGVSVGPAAREERGKREPAERWGVRPPGLHGHGRAGRRCVGLRAEEFCQPLAEAGGRAAGFELVALGHALQVPVGHRLEIHRLW